MKVQRTISDPEPWPLHVPSSVRLGPGGAPELCVGRCSLGGVHRELGTSQNQTRRLGGAASEGTWRERLNHFRIPGFWAWEVKAAAEGGVG